MKGGGGDSSARSRKTQLPTRARLTCSSATSPDLDRFEQSASVKAGQRTLNGSHTLLPVVAALVFVCQTPGDLDLDLNFGQLRKAVLDQHSVQVMQPEDRSVVEGGGADDTVDADGDILERGRSLLHDVDDRLGQVLLREVVLAHTQIYRDFDRFE